MWVLGSSFQCIAVCCFAGSMSAKTLKVSTQYPIVFVKKFGTLFALHSGDCIAPVMRICELRYVSMATVGYSGRASTSIYSNFNEEFECEISHKITRVK